MSDVRRPRRYYLLKQIAIRARGCDALAAVFASKQSAQPGNQLPTEFPARAKLALRGYTTIEDIDGADASELGRAGLSSKEAALVIEAVATAMARV